jgi:hypothetical protein
MGVPESQKPARPHPGTSRNASQPDRRPAALHAAVVYSGLSPDFRQGRTSFEQSLESLLNAALELAQAYRSLHA